MPSVNKNLLTLRVDAIVGSRPGQKMDDSGEGERIFRLQMTHYLSQIQPSSGLAEMILETPVTVNDFLSLAHLLRSGATRGLKKRNKRLLTLLGVPALARLEKTLIQHYFLACLFWYFSLVDFQKPRTVREAVTAEVLPSIFAKPARYFFQQLVSGKVLQRRGHSTFDLVRPFVSSLMSTIQMIKEIIESDKLLSITAWNYGEFMKVVQSCASYTIPCRRATWLLTLRRRLSSELTQKAPVSKKTRRAAQHSSRNRTRRHRDYPEEGGEDRV